MINELADDYSEYLRVDLAKELAPAEETIEDILTRLEEFESLVDMVKNDPSYDLSQPVIDIAACKEELNALCERIDSLETFVGKVSRDMDVVESHLDAAKAEIGGSDETFKNMLKPLFFKKPDPAPPVPTKSPSYEPPKLFRTADYFNIHSKTDDK